MQKGKTSTFTIHHDRCDPASWTAHDILTFAKFVSGGSLQHAARLSSLGMQLVLSEHHQPKGGSLEEMGFAPVDDIAEPTDNLADFIEDDITPVVRIYRGPIEYVVQYAIGDGDGHFDGHEYEIKTSEADARAFLAGLKDEAA